MTRTSERHPRPSKKPRRYCPKRVSLYNLTIHDVDRVIDVQEPYYGQLKCGDKVVEGRPNYPSYHNLRRGHQIEFRNPVSGDSFVVRITSKNVYTDFDTMLRTETVQDCLPDHDPWDVPRAVNTYHSFRGGLYKNLAERFGVLSFRFVRVKVLESSQPDQVPQRNRRAPRSNSLCAIFDAWEKLHPTSKVTW